MFTFPQSVNPAVRSHVDAQFAFLNDLSRSMTRSFQDVFQLNMQLCQTLIEETALISQGLMSTERPNDALTAAASRAQPATDKLRAYQQNLSGLAASARSSWRASPNAMVRKRPAPRAHWRTKWPASRRKRPTATCASRKKP